MNTNTVGRASAV